MSKQQQQVSSEHDGLVKIKITKEERKVVFKTSSSYQFYIFILLAIAPVSTIGGMFLVYFDDSTSDEEKWRAWISLFFTTVAILIVFALVLPMQLEVRSDASIGIQTCLGITWTFTNVTAAYSNPSFSENFRRGRFKFATSIRNRVLVRRRGPINKHSFFQHWWDVVVSPADAPGFVQAIETVVAQSSTIHLNEENEESE